MNDTRKNGGLRPESEPDNESNAENALPRLIPGGRGMYSIKALVERVAAEFENEHGESSPALLASETRSERIKLLRGTVDYVLAVESVSLAPDDLAELIRFSYSEVYGYGPLDPLITDPTITTIALEGIDKVSVRYGHGDLKPADTLFEDHRHLRRIIQRMLHRAHAELNENEPYLEVGFTVEDRRAGLNLVGPPVTLQLQADIRLHPETLPELDTFSDDAVARQLLNAIAHSPHGFVIVGQPESGKTTLLAVLTHLLESNSIVAVERSAEMQLPDHVQRLSVQWPYRDQTGLSFGQQVNAALEREPDCIILDEVRADESEAIVPLLLADPPPRLIWTFRGPTSTKRLISALGMLARRGDALTGSGTDGEALVRALYQRLPFVIAVRRHKQRLHLHRIGEWQFAEGADYPDFVELLEWDEDRVRLSGKRAQNTLDLPDDFWP